MTDSAKSAARIRAACYIRMSTENQRYSSVNQAAAIDEYAERRGFTIVQTYIDKGKSGLTIKGRLALQALISDVQCAQTDFEVLLVYDVSRWGRFQDADESAYYEFICRRSGVAVIYCAEQFDNDGSPASVLIKSIKRAMAGEYSRELSIKTFSGQCRLTELGFRQGGAPGVGLRRMLVGPDGTPKAVMRYGEQKFLQSDRVILVLGPPEEVAIVHRIYRLFLDDKRSITAITNLLNAEGVLTDIGRRWTIGVVRNVLSNEKYLGHNVFNKTSRKLRTQWVKNPSHKWVRADGVYPALVDTEKFERARLLLLEKCPRPTSEKMIADLARLHERVGKVNERIINQARGGMVGAAAYRKRFGSLENAFKLAGVQRLYPSNEAMLQDLVQLHQRVGRLSWRLVNRDKSLGSVSAYKTRFGSLENAYILAGLGHQRPTNETLIEDLVRLHKRVGRVSNRLITVEEGMSSGQTYRNRFGSLANAYKLAGIA